MALFDDHIEQLRAFLSDGNRRRNLTCFDARQTKDWPAGDRSNLVLSADTAVELGSPQTASTAFLLWTDDFKKIEPGAITLVGPDTCRETRTLVPFGKAVLVAVEGFDEHNSYDRFREMELTKYDIRLSGYMMRAVSQYQREWSRISRQAVKGGFSLAHLGRATVDGLLALPYVKAVEIVYITASIEEVLAVKPISDSVAAIIGAMNKMVEEMDFDCSSCDYRPVCDSVSELRSMRRARQKKDSD